MYTIHDPILEISAGTNPNLFGSAFLRFGSTMFGFGRKAKGSGGLKFGVVEVYLMFVVILAELCWKFGLFWGIRLYDV